MRKTKIIKFTLITSFIFYTLFVIWNILFKYASPLEFFSDDRYFSRSINLIPFNDLFEGNYLKLDVWGNMILFAPFGVYLKLYSSKQWYRLLPVAVITSVLFEVLQYIFGLGATDVTDVIYNTSGFVIGNMIYTILNGILKDNDRVKLLVSVFAGISMLFVAIIVILLYAYN